jgi:hypothetical protein
VLSLALVTAAVASLIEYRPEAMDGLPSQQTQRLESRPIVPAGIPSEAELVQARRGPRAHPFYLHWPEHKLAELNDGQAAQTEPDSTDHNHEVAQPQTQTAEVVQDDAAGSRLSTVPAPESFPLKLVGWIDHSRGLVAILQDRESGEQFQVVRGDLLDEYEFAVNRVARDGVLLQDAEGMRYRLRHGA